MKNNILHIVLAALLVLLLVLLSDPFMLWMPPMAAMAVLVGAAVTLCIWAGFVMYERVSDEREVLHRMKAGRIAYLAGIGILTVGFLWQGLLVHSIDPWITIALGIMVLSKLATGLYFSLYR